MKKKESRAALDIQVEGTRSCVSNLPLPPVALLCIFTAAIREKAEISQTPELVASPICIL